MNQSSIIKMVIPKTFFALFGSFVATICLAIYVISIFTIQLNAKVESFVVSEDIVDDSTEQDNFVSIVYKESEPFAPPFEIHGSRAECQDKVISISGGSANLEFSCKNGSRLETVYNHRDGIYGNTIFICKCPH